MQGERKGFLKKEKWGGVQGPAKQWREGPGWAQRKSRGLLPQASPFYIAVGEGPSLVPVIDEEALPTLWSSE